MVLERLFSFLSVLLIAMIGLCVPGCIKNYPPPPKLPEPVVNQQVGPGDLLEIVVVGEEKLPKDYEIDGSGVLMFPYAEPVKVSGLEPRQIASSVRDELIKSKYLVDPQVQVKVKDYN